MHLLNAYKVNFSDRHMCSIINPALTIPAFPTEILVKRDPDAVSRDRAISRDWQVTIESSVYTLYIRILSNFAVPFCDKCCELDFCLLLFCFAWFCLLSIYVGEI